MLKGRYHARVWGKDSGVGCSKKKVLAQIFLANILQANCQRKGFKDRYYASVWVSDSVGCSKTRPVGENWFKVLKKRVKVCYVSKEIQ